MKIKDLPNIHLKRKVFVAMSGGVDSSVAAFFLKQEGYDVIGVFMRCWSQRSSDALGVGVPCGTERDSEDARRVAEKLDIPFYVWDFEKEYKEKVVNYMIDGYKRGITPNPDVMCNREIKFGLFLKKALEAGADFVATGHHVKATCNKQHETRTKKHVSCLLSLVSARDANKDQSYFLWTLTQEQLRHCLFPVGTYLKSEVREIARKAGLPTAEKKDSQGICFLGKVTLSDFLKQYIPAKRGDVLTIVGQKIGEHDGSWFYTVGQRHIGVNFQFSNSVPSGHLSKRDKNQKPMYVAEKNIKTNTVTVAEGSENTALYKNEIELTDVNFIRDEKQETSDKMVYVRVRYRQPLVSATLMFHASRFTLHFKEPVKFVASGQSAVLYERQETRNKKQGEYELLGGGIIL